MYDRTITIGSAGKCFSATGWKLGWVIGPEWVLQPLKKVIYDLILNFNYN